MTDSKEFPSEPQTGMGPGTPAPLKPTSSGFGGLGAAALTVLSYALLVDAAVETFLSGSPVRLLVAATVAAYMVLTVCLWRFGSLRSRFGWSARASAPFFVLLGVLALTAWLPGGLTNGAQMLRQPTSIVLSAVSALAVAVAGLVLVRVRFLSWWGRAALGLLALYGVAAFAVGVIEAVPYPNLFQGGSLWRRLPYWLQGAFIGTLIAVPLAMVAAIVDAFRHLRAAEGRGWGFQQSLALGLATLMAVSGFTMNGGPVVGVADPGRAGPQLSAGEITKPLDDTYRGPGMKGPAHDHLKLPVPRTFDLTHVEPIHYAAALGKDPQRIFEFVRDHVAYEVYAGCLRGPRGTLLAMAGNSVDRAALLAALLKEAGGSVRFVKGNLPEAKAKDLVLSMWGVPQVQFPKEGEISPAVKASAATVLAGVKRDFNAIRDRLKKADKAPAGDPGPSLDALIEEARDHYWVQLSKDGAWIDFDASFADATPGQAHAKVQETFAALPESLFHRVAIRIRVEESSILVEGGEAGEPVSREVLSFSTKAADLSGRDVVLTHQPENWTGPARDVQSALSTVIANTGRIKPVLLAGPKEVIAGAPFYYELPPDKGLGGVGGLLGGTGTRTPVPIATAETVEVDFVSPGGHKETVIREIFDRAGPARRAGGKNLEADEIRLKLAAKEDKTTGAFSFFFTTGRLDMAQLRGVTPPTPPEEASSKKGKAINIRDSLRSINISFVAISDGLLERLTREGEAVVRFYPDSPRLQIAELNIRDRRFTLDLRRDRVGAVAAGAPAGTVFYGRVLRGVVEGSLERAVVELITTELVREEKWGKVMSTSTLFEKAYADGIGINLFAGDRPVPSKTIPEDARARVEQALIGGNWVIAPERAFEVGGRQRFAWWQVDPRSGETIAVTDDGLHQAGTDTGGTYAVISGGPVAGVMMVIVYEGGVITQAVLVLATSVSAFLATVGPMAVR